MLDMCKYNMASQYDSTTQSIYSLDSEEPSSTNMGTMTQHSEHTNQKHMRKLNMYEYKQLVVVSFKSVHNSERWALVSVYGPCEGQPRDDFVSWLYHLTIPPDENWMLLGDFNFIRSLDNRNQPGGDINDIFLFNEVIEHLGLLELPIKGRNFTWSNMQQIPLLE